MNRKFTLIFSLLIALAVLMPAAVIAAPPAQDGGQDYTVQANDWLSKLADKFYGDIFSYPAIVKATNEKALTDDSYAIITNPDVIEVGQKLYIPAADEAAAILSALPSAKNATITVTDDLGREVNLPAAAERIISLAPSNTEILFAVGAGDKVVGVTTYCNYPEAATTKDTIGGFSPDTISVETIVALQPDVVFSAGGLQMPVIEALEKLNIPVVALDPATIDGIYSDIELVGKITGNEDGAAAVVNDMQTRIAAVTDVVSQVPAEERPTVFWETWDDPLMTAGPTSFIGQMIEAAGGVNIFGDITDQQYPVISAEEVISRNPQVIMGSDSHGDKLTVEAMSARPGWDQIDAVQNGRIYLIQGDIASRAAPRVADAIEVMAKSLYPDLFK